METAKYLFFYALLIGVIILGVMNTHWMIIFPAALVLSLTYIFVKGANWKRLMGNTDLNTTVVFTAVFMSQCLLAAIFWGIGRLIVAFI